MRTSILTDNVRMGAVDASATPLGFWRAPCACVIESIYLLTSSAVAAHATDISTHTVTNRGVAAAGTTVVATRTTDTDVAGSAAIVAKVPWSVTVTAANAQVAEGEVLEFAPTEGGTATTGDLANATYQINYRPGCGAYYSG